MKRRIRTIALLTILVCICTAVLSWPSLLKYIVQSSLTDLRARGFAISWKGISTSMTTVELEQANGWLSVPAAQRNGKTLKVPITLDLKQISVKLRGTSLLSLSPSFPFSVALYGGKIAGEAQLLAKEPVLAVTIDNVEIGQHPQIAALGIQGGIVTASTKNLRIKQQGVPEGTFSVVLTDLVPPASLTATQPSLPMGPISLSTTGSIEGEKLSFDSLDLSSAVGSIKSNGTLTGLSGYSSKFNGSAHISVAQSAILTIVPQIKYLLGDSPFPDIDLSWKGGLEGDDLSLDTVKLATDLGSADGRAKVVGVRSVRPTVDGNIRINLSDRGASTLGKWLPLLTGNAVDASAKTFRINVLSVGCEQEGAQRLYGALCLKTSFAE